MRNQKKIEEDEQVGPTVDIVCCTASAVGTATNVLLFDIFQLTLHFLLLYTRVSGLVGAWPFMFAVGALEMLYYWVFCGLHNARQRSYSKAFYIFKYLVAAFLALHTGILWKRFFDIPDIMTGLESPAESRNAVLSYIIPESVQMIWSLISARIVQICVLALEDDDFKHLEEKASATAEMSINAKLRR
jgi:hypothetical protein